MFSKLRVPGTMALAAVLVLGSAAQADVILNETTFNLSAGVPIETITDGGGPLYGDPQGGDTNFSPGSDTVNGWTFYIEQSTTNQMAFAPGSNLATDAPDGVGEGQLGSKIVTTLNHGVGDIAADVLNMDYGGAGAIAGIAQTFTSLGGEVTITVIWGRHERPGSGLDIVDGTGAFGSYDYQYMSATKGTTYTHTFTPTQPTFKLFFASNAVTGTPGGNHDANGTIDYIKVEQVLQLPLVWDVDTGTTGAQDGVGTWIDTGDNWWDEKSESNVAWDNTKAALASFGAGNAAADTTVTVDATGVTAGGIVFNDAGGHKYTLTGGTITLEGGATIEANVDARIESAIAAAAGFTKTGPGTLELTGESTYTGGVAVTGGTLVGDTGSLRGDVALSNDSNVTFNQESDGAYDDIITGDGSFTKTGAGTLEVTSQEHAYTGDATVSDGTLHLTGWLPLNTTVIVEDGGTLGGAGHAAAIDLLRGGTLAPGASVERLTADGDVTLGAGAAYEWEVNDLDSTTADWDPMDINWDLLEITTGFNLIVSATPGDPFGIKVLSLDSLGDPGAAAGTLEAGDSFEIVRLQTDIGGTIVGFSADAFTIDTSAFLNPMGGLGFVVAQRGGSLYLDVLAPPLWDADTVAAGAQDGDGTWSDGGGNWWNGSGNVAWDNTKADVATFGAAGAGADTTVTVDTVTAGGIVFNDANGYKYTLTGGTITLEGGATIEANVDARIESAIAAAAGFTKTGPGTLALAGARNLAALSLAEGTTRLASGGTSLLVTEALSVAPAAALDLAEGSLIVDFTGDPNPLETITDWVASGHSGGTWQGPGINSSTAAADMQLKTAVGVIDNADGEWAIGGLTEFAGVPVDETSILVACTWAGDANLDGRITSADYDRIDVNWLRWKYNGTVPDGGFRWAVGDFNYDGVISTSDYDLIDRAWLISNGAPFGAGSPTPTPEPATLALVAAGLAALVVRKRKT